MKSSPKLSALLVAFLSLALFATACSSDPTAEPGGTTSSDPTDPDDGSGGSGGTSGSGSAGTGGASSQGTTVTVANSFDEQTDAEIQITLDHAPGQDEPEVNPETTVTGDPLDPDAAGVLLDRLPDIETETDDQLDFNRPPDTLPRPRPGTTLDQPFPPEAAPPVDRDEPDDSPLEILRYQPEGPVDLAPFISVTFNQPMVALSTVSQVEAENVPINITPEMPGRWIWLGARTVRFEYEPGAIDRIPAATNYTVEIPAGTTSANGNVLETPLSFEFSTPAARVVAVTPAAHTTNDHSGPPTIGLNPIFVIQFDQRVDPDAVTEAIRMTAGNESVPFRLATGDEINEDTIAERAAENLLPDRWIAITPEDDLPKGSPIEITVGPNVPSLEGPETSESSETFVAFTYGPFDIERTECGYDGNCRPGQSFDITMSNRIDGDEFTADMVTVSPEIPGMRVRVTWNNISIQGLTAGRTDYDVTIASNLTDIYGQELGKEETITFRVGDAEPGLIRPRRNLVTLDPMVADNALNVASINHSELRVTIYDVDPTEDWVDYQDRSWEFERGDWEPGWQELDSRTIDTQFTPNVFGEAAIDLSDELDSSGHLVVFVEPVDRSDDDYRNRPFSVWVQRTTLGVDAFVEANEAVAWVTDLRTGEPISGADVTLFNGTPGTTDAQGIARLDVPSRSRGVLAEHDGQSALVADFWADTQPVEDQLRWYIIDDRGLYKPGETANLKGWLRTADYSVPSDLTLPEEGSVVAWTATDAFGNQIDSGEAELTALGGFDLEIELPLNITLGSASVQFSAPSIENASRSGGWHELRVQEFRRPDFEVATAITDEGPLFVGETFTATVAADYFAGGALGSSPVEWTVTASPSSYSPPNWQGFTFGVWVPWWRSHFFEDFGSETAAEFFSTATDAAGEHALAVTVDNVGIARPITVTTSATVVDVTRQPITNSADTLLHPADLYVGMRSDRTFIRQGERLNLDVIVTNIDGEAQSGHDVTVTPARIEWQFENGSWAEVDIPGDPCEVTSSDAPTACSFRPETGGRYRITATVTDAEGRQNHSEFTRWVSGGSLQRPAGRQVDLEELTIVPNAQTFEPGETAEILIQSPFVDAHGLMIISRGDIHSTEGFELDESGSAIVQIPISSEDIPGIRLQFEVAGTAPRLINGQASDQVVPRPAFAAGDLVLEVPPTERILTVEATPAEAKLQPGETTSLDVVVTDADGEPVADAELTVIVVDEAVLSLTNYQLGDPLAAFYPLTPGFAQVSHGRSSVLLSDPDIDGTDDLPEPSALEAAGDEEAMSDDAAMAESDLAFDSADAGTAAAAAPAEGRAFIQEGGGNLDRDGQEAAPIELRSNFDALAVFDPEVTTDAQGTATIDVPLPDNLTRYRVMVLAAAEATDAGTGESNITARLPVTVRPTPPRFANFGDVFDFPVIVQNATDEDLDVDVALRATNLTVSERQGATVTVPANDRVEVRFEVAADEAGTARYQVVASAGSFSDAADGDFPVYTPATSEAFATYGVVDAGTIAQPISEPADVFPQFGGLEISTSSTAVAALTDAVIYMNEYRYDSSDALASRVIAIVSLDDILEAFKAEQLPSPEALLEVMNADIDGLERMQNSDGGFPYWRRGRESIPFNSVQAAHALILAQESGYEVNQQVLDNAKWYIANIEDHYPSWYGQRTRTAISSYALHVRLLGGDRDADKAARIYREAGDDIALDAAAWLWPVVADTDLDNEIEQLLNNRVTDTPKGATFATSYGEDAWVILHSDRRTDAIILDALVTMRPESDLVVKTLNGILGARDGRGHWRNIQENSFVLLAGAKYFENFENVDPDFIARAWLGDTYAVEHEYTQRSTDQNATLVPMADLLEAGDTDILVQKDGDDGRLYYRLGLRYAPTDFELEPRDQGFVVQRSYEAIDDPSDVVQNDDGTWTIESGARVRVRLNMVADSRRTHVALIDPIPAGFEIVNPALATSEPIPQEDPTEAAYSSYWWYRWFDHQNLRDDRAEAFSTWLGAGSYEYTYVVRATTPGVFQTPPTRAEQMYEPEVFGRSASTTVTIQES